MPVPVSDKAGARLKTQRCYRRTQQHSIEAQDLETLAVRRAFCACQPPWVQTHHDAYPISAYMTLQTFIPKQSVRFERLRGKQMLPLPGKAMADLAKNWVWRLQPRLAQCLEPAPRRVFKRYAFCKSWALAGQCLCFCSLQILLLVHACS